MNKNILKVTLVTAIALFAEYNLYSSLKTVELSDLALANVEALAYYVEVGDGGYDCEAPYNAECSVELGVSLKGYKYEGN